MKRHWSTNPLRFSAWHTSQWLCRRMLQAESSRAAAFWRFFVRACPEGRPS